MPQKSLKKTIIIFISFFIFNYFIFSSEVKLVSVGDVIPHLEVQQYGLRNNNFNVLFDRIKKLIKTGNIVIANFESSIDTKKPVSGYPRFNAHPMLMKALKETGFNVLSLANNHSLDMGGVGLNQTVKNANENGFIHNGISLNQKDIFKPVYFEKNGIKFSFLSVTTSTNGFANPGGANTPKVFILTSSTINIFIKSLAEMRKNSDFVIVSLHFGDEYIDEPTAGQKRLAEFIVKSGADLILGNHSHHIQRPVWNTKYNRKALISYSQGNFISHQNRHINNANKNSIIAKRGDSFLLNIYLKKISNKVEIISFTYTPTWTLVFLENSKPCYKVVPLFSEIKKPLFREQVQLLIFRRKRIIEFMKGFTIEEIN